MTPNETRTDPAAEHTRPCYEPRQIRAADLQPDDVMLHEGHWRYVRDVVTSGHLDIIDDLDLSDTETALFRAYLIPDTHVLVEVDIESPGSLTPARIYAPYSRYDLVTIQAENGMVLRGGDKIVKLYGPPARILTLPSSDMLAFQADLADRAANRAADMPSTTVTPADDDPGSQT